MPSKPLELRMERSYIQGNVLNSSRRTESDTNGGIWYMSTEEPRGKTGQVRPSASRKWLGAIQSDFLFSSLACIPIYFIPYTVCPPFQEVHASTEDYAITAGLPSSSLRRACHLREQSLFLQHYPKIARGMTSLQFVTSMGMERFIRAPTSIGGFTS